MWKINEPTCIGCGACVATCPEKILELVDKGGEQKASIGGNQDKCTSCKTCENTCPVQAIKVE